MTTEPESSVIPEPASEWPVMVWVQRDGHRVEVPIEASTAEEYLALLRGVFKVAGRTAGTIAKYTGMPRSTVYSYTSPKKPALPKYRDQLESFLIACKLTETQVQAMLTLWVTLKDEPHVVEQVVHAAELVEDEPAGDVLPLRKAEVVTTKPGTDLVRASDIGKLLDRTHSGELDMNGLMQALHQLTGQTRDVHVHVHGNINITSTTTSTTNTSSTTKSDVGETSPTDQPRDVATPHRLSDGEARTEHSLFGDAKSRFRNMLVLMTIVAIIGFGLIAVLVPDRAVITAGVIAIVGMMGAALVWLTRKD